MQWAGTTATRTRKKNTMDRTIQPVCSGKMANGITLVELSLAMVLTCLLATLSFPNLRHLNTRTDTYITLQRLGKALESAKVSAISSGEIVTLCGSADSLNCQGGWGDGLLSFIDRNENRTLDSVDQALNWQPMKDIEGTIKWQAFGNRQYLLLDPRGMMETQNGSFTYCNISNEAAAAAKLVINRTARMRTLRDLNPLENCH